MTGYKEKYKRKAPRTLGRAPDCKRKHYSNAAQPRGRFERILIRNTCLPYQDFLHMPFQFEQDS